MNGKSQDLVEIYLHRGASAFEAGDLDTAEQEFRRAMAIAPDSAGVHFNLGLLYRARGRPLDALSHFREAVLLDPGDHEAYTLLGSSAIDIGMFPEAEEFLMEAIRLSPEHAAPRYHLGDLYLRTGKLDEAISILEEASRLSPEHAPSWYLLGQVYRRAGRQEDARTAFEECLRCDPAHPDARATLDASHPAVPHRRFRIGFVTVWHERGQAYVTKTLRDALAPDYDTFILARSNEFDGRSRLETAGEWAMPNLTPHPAYEIPPDVLRSWISDNRLDIVIFNEEYDWNLVRACKETGVRTSTYLDYYEEAWRPLLPLYDTVLCSTERTYSLVKDCCNACYIGWGVDTSLFRPAPFEERAHTFFHNAGWAGVSYRKMTPAVIVAFHTISRHLPHISLLVHSQRRLTEYPPEICDIVRENDRITFYEGTLPQPGLYNKGQIYVYPAKLDGLGLTLFEALASGLPAIVTDAPPMNEFVHDGENGLLVRVATTMHRNDGIAFPEAVIDLNDLAVKMAFLASNPDLVTRLGEKARRRIEEEYSLDHWRHHLHLVMSQHE